MCAWSTASWCWQGHPRDTGAGHNGAMSSSELGSFIRRRREAITPPEVGLPTSGRRRTPGLRRAELATVAGVSVDYLIRIEQGRDTNPSAGVVLALADALRLDDEDRDHLKRLAAITGNAEFCPTHRPPATRVRPAIDALLGRLSSTPAMVVNGVADIIAWTPTFASLAGPVGILDGDPANLIRYTFADPRARTTFADWTRVADEQVAGLRSVSPTGDGVVEDLVAELRETAGREFSERWNRHDVARREIGIVKIRHPLVDEVRCTFETLTLSDVARQQLVVWLPADDVSAQRLDELAGRHPGGLYAVE